MNNKAFNRFFYIALAILAIIYWVGMHLTLMDVDSSTYALLSKQMFQSGHYLELYLNGKDYLDKPPLVFWSACLAYKLFGIHDWAYRLPSVLCLTLGIYSTYRYARIFYSEQAAKMAALIMASCMASYVMTSDVRIDTMLTGWVMFSMWQLAEYFKISNIVPIAIGKETSNNEIKGIYFKIRHSIFSIQHLLLGAVGVGLAMMTKGPIGLIIPVTAFAGEFIYKRQWDRFFRWQYLVAILVIAVLLLPMSYGLYEQFDLHPEKVMYNRTGTSGLRFFYWTQSFGRITGESSWNNNPDPFFLYHSFLWSFAPWCVFFIPALFTGIKNIIKNYKDPEGTEAITLAGFLLILIFLSRSKYQLPHYTFAIHPLAAVITASYLDKQFSSAIRPALFKAFYGINIFMALVIYAIAFLIVLLIFPAPVGFPVVIALSLVCFFYILFSFHTELNIKVLLLTIIPFITLTFIFNTYFYPKVLTYQTGSYIAKQLNGKAPGGSQLVVYKDYHDFAMQFYSDFPIAEGVDENSLKSYLIPGKTYILADTAYSKEIENVEPSVCIIGRYYSHSPTLLSWPFLNPATRSAHEDHRLLMKY